MVFQVRTEKDLKSLLKPASKAMIETQIPDGYQKLEKLEKSVERLTRRWKQTNGLLIDKCAELQLLRMRIIALESKAGVDKNAQ